MPLNYHPHCIGTTKVKLDLYVLSPKVQSKTGVKFGGKKGTEKIDHDMCADGFKNGEETDMDCGGKCAAKCAMMKGCKKSGDCVGNFPCTAGKCGATSCIGLFKSGVRKNGMYVLTDVSTKKQTKVYCSLTDNADGQGWTGGVGKGGENPGWFHLDTCGKSWNRSPDANHCAAYLKSPSKRASSDMLPWYGTERPVCRGASKQPSPAVCACECAAACARAGRPSYSTCVRERGTGEGRARENTGTHRPAVHSCSHVLLPR